MRKNIFLQLLLILFAVIIHPSLHSDDFFLVKDKIIEESRFKIGFFYLTPLIHLQNVGYTSNIFTYEKTENPDWTGDLGLGLRVSAIIGKRLLMQAEDLPYYSFYLENKTLRAWSNRFLANAYSYAGPFNLKAGFSQNNLRQRPNLEFGRPFRYSDREWTGEIDFGRRTNLFFTAYAKFKQLDYDENEYLNKYDLAKALNQRQNVFGFRLNQHIFTRTLVFLNYELSQYRFAFETARDARAQQMALGVEFPEIGLLQGNFQIGFKQFEPSNPLFRFTRRPSGRGDIRASLFERLRLNVFYELQTYFSYGSSDLFYDNQSYGGGAEVYLTRFLKGGTTYQNGSLKYYSFLDSGLKRSDRLRQQRYYLALPFLGSMAIGLSYNIFRLTSDALAFDQSYKFWGGFINYEF